MNNFNPRSRKGSDEMFEGQSFILADFNPRSRKGSDGDHGAERAGYGISIHAPARGATDTTVNLFEGFDISIHAPARGATFPVADVVFCESDFNPRSRKGSDHPNLIDRLSKIPISIHAPARGATY